MLERSLENRLQRDHVVNALRAHAATRPGPSNPARICSTGELAREIGGYLVGRTAAIRMTGGRGRAVAGSVSRELKARVCAEPDSMSGKVREAGEFGVRIIAEHPLWRNREAMN
jgi:hypothetical protein